MALAERKFKIGQMVYTKIVGYPPWPSCIIAFRNGKKELLATVRYFGWKNEM